ncbi:restriction endonuclease [Kitasatospora sp. NPDC059722]|uniref:restriction endonuclease n=1 Tax=Kitasatospora sp. NPDC059722 TaxID=3346925 RepID=UPI00367DA4DB
MAQRRANSWQADQQRRQQAAQREFLRQQREVARMERAAEADRKRQERERHQAHLDRQAKLAADRTMQVEKEIDQLRRLLQDSLTVDLPVSLRQLRRTHKPQRFDPSPWPGPGPAPRWEDYAPAQPGALAKIFGGGRRYEEQLAQAQHRFSEAEGSHQRLGRDHDSRLQQRRAEHQSEQNRQAAAVQKFNDELEGRFIGYRAGDPTHVEWFLDQVLDASSYPKKFPRHHRVAFRATDASALVEIRLPSEDIVPAERGFTHVKSRDEVKTLPRPEKERKELYASVLAQCALRAVHEIFAHDRDGVVDSVVLNGHVTTVDRATGQQVSPCLITLSTDREQFDKLLLSQVDPTACLKYLNAIVSPNPYDLEPVRPIVEFDLTKYRLMDSLDVVSGLDSRPVLTQLTPTEFEHLVRQLFEAIGLEAWNTQASKDEGVDAVAISKDPIFNGECIIQAKRYTKLVGVESVQALAGVVEHKRAAKGVLITTSWFGRASHTFAAAHGRLQLIEGAELVYLIKEHLGKDVIAGPVPPKRRSSR